MGDLWSARFFFLATWRVGYFFTAVQEFFLLHSCCMQFFSSDKRLREIFFQNHAPPPSRVKWSAPNDLMTFSFRRNQPMQVVQAAMPGYPGEISSFVKR